MAALPYQNVQLIILCSVFLLLSIIAVGLRLVTRRIKHTSLALNDYLIVWALILLCGEVGIVINAKSIVPVGVHDASILKALVVREYKTYLASDILWFSIMASIKLSILHLYLTIFTSKPFYKWIGFIMALNVLWWIGMFIEELTVCRPLSYTWDKSIEGHCGDILAGYISSAVINVVLDVAVIILPMRILWKLQMRLSKKLLISGIFGLGIIVVIISILRIQALTKLKLDDLQYNSFYTDLYSVLEPCIAVVTACLPVMQPLYAKLASYEIISSLRSSLFSRSRKYPQDSLGYSNREWRSPVKSVHGNETRHFDRIYDSVYPLTDRNITLASAEGNVENKKESDDVGIAVKYDVDIASGNVSRERNIDNV